jgi:membrane-associated phospholipid phosphatase
MIRGRFGVLAVAGILLVPAAAKADDPAPLPGADGDLSRFLPKDHAEDGRRTIGALPKNIGRSFIGVFSKDNLGPFVIGAAATGTASIFDTQAKNFLAFKADDLGQTGSTAGGLTVMAPLTLSLFAVGRFAHDGAFRAFSYDATQAIVVNGIYTQILKTAVSRTRPDGSNQLSFPSGHASSAFALATVAERHYGWKVGVPSYVAASAIGLSRIERNKHYLSDVLAGATLGIISGRTVVRTNGEPTGRQRSFSLTPMTDAQGTGVGVGASVSW